jgi:hypothetical protein
MLLKKELVYRTDGEDVVFNRVHIDNPFRIPGIFSSANGCRWGKVCKYHQNINGGMCTLRSKTGLKIPIYELKCGFDLYSPYNFPRYGDYINYKYICY